MKLTDLPLCPECDLHIENEFEHFPYEVCDPKFVKARREGRNRADHFKTHSSIRLRAFQKEIIIREFGTVQKYIDHKIKQDEQKGLFDD